MLNQSVSNVDDNDKADEVAQCNSKTIWFFVLTSILVLMTVGCNSISKEQWAAADYGTKPSEQEAQQLHVQAIRSYLKDPDSAKFQHMPMREAAYKLNYKDPVFGWLLVTNVNAKNSFGGYTGFQPHYFFFPNGGSPMRIASHMSYIIKLDDSDR